MSKEEMLSEEKTKRVLADLYLLSREIQDNVFNGEVKLKLHEKGYLLETEFFNCNIMHKEGGVWQ